MEKTIAISILNCSDIPAFLKEIQKVEERIQTLKINHHFFKFIIHFDVMDHQFVPNTGIDLKYIKTAKNMGFYADTHLMVQKPVGDQFIKDAIAYGTDSVTIHFEIEHFEKILQAVNTQKNELKKYEGRELVVGVSVKPDTDIQKLTPYQDQFTKLLIMGVEPGFGGQQYIDKINDKIKEARKLFPHHIIQVDGGIQDETMIIPFRYGVNSFVIGNFLTSSKSEEELYHKILKLNLIKELEELEKDANTEFQQKILQIVPGGYGQKDRLLGISVPNLRKIANHWYPYLPLSSLDTLISSKYHEYRQLAIFILSNLMKKADSNHDQEKMKQIYQFLVKNLAYINNWDLTDEVGPNIVGSYLLTLSKEEQKEKIYQYIQHDNTWIKRIGIVSMLAFVRKDSLELPFEVCDHVVYEEYHLFQKATGWVLRELYKREPVKIVEYMIHKNKEKRLPKILLSYACEKMSSKEKMMCKE